MLDKEAAELADRTKSAFVATVSHEVFTELFSYVVLKVE